MTSPLEISNTEMQTAQRCPRQWALTYHWHWQPREAPPIGKAAMGTSIHTALEAWYGYDINPLVALRWVYDRHLAQHPHWTEALTTDAELATNMVTGFRQWVEESGVDSTLDVVDVEHELRVPYQVDDDITVIWRAKLDQLVRDRVTGGYYLRDWKTVDTLMKGHQIARNQQMRFYALLLSLLHKDDSPPIVVHGALYTMLKRSKRTLRATPPFYDQISIIYNGDDHNSTYLRASTVSKRIVEWHTQLDAGEDHRSVVYPNATDFCEWGCPFRSVCTLLDDGSRWEEALAAHYVHDDPYRYYDKDLITDLVRELGE